ncbi:MAG: aminoacyl-tRNA hydrolase [Opitutae bacterium]|nr:aminoacyl-tRNA hydrolase [Opitutae bacterium]
MSISLVVGLGNPGRDYADTRHNLGWLVLDAFARSHDLSWRASTRFEAQVARWDRSAGRTLWLAKPQTFMNESGRAVGALMRFHKLEPAQVAVIYDDLTIALGQPKLSVRGSAGGHNGVASLLEHLGDGFIRYRIGIGPKEPSEMDLKDFVLGKFTPAQRTLIDQQLEHYLTGLALLLDRGVTEAMNQLNRRNPT